MLSKNLNDLLKKKRITVYQLSEYTGISTSYLYALKNGERRNPSIEKVNSLCYFFKCEISDLI